MGSALLVLFCAGVCMAQGVSDEVQKALQRLNKNGEFNISTPLFQSPAKAVPTVEVPRTTYVDMLRRGYVINGSMTYTSTKHGLDEALGKKDILAAATLLGADAAWISTSSEKKVEGVYVPGGTYYDYQSHRPNATYTIQPHTASKTVKYVNGMAIIFVHNPDLAARQLEEGKKRWEIRMAEIPLKQAALLDKLDTVLKALSSTDASLFGGTSGSDVKEEYVRRLQATEEEVKTGRCGFYPGGRVDESQMGWKNDTELKWSKPSCTGLLALVELSNIFYYVENGMVQVQQIFKDPASPQLAKLHIAVMDAWRYEQKNISAVFDFTSPTLAEHFLPNPGPAILGSVGTAWSDSFIKHK
ncbi:MAG: hypothetical protein WCA89_01225 [Terracidiphilus sp.]